MLSSRADSCTLSLAPTTRILPFEHTPGRVLGLGSQTTSLMPLSDPKLVSVSHSSSKDVLRTCSRLSSCATPPRCTPIRIQMTSWIRHVTGRVSGWTGDGLAWSRHA